MKRKFIFAVLLVMACASIAFAQGADSKEAFLKANALYAEAKYAEAIAAYEKIIDSGIESGNIYYNLGNAYFKKNALGEAILNYERARRLMPGDGDLESNYSHARSLIGRSVPEAPRKRFARFIDGRFRYLTLNNMAILLSALYISIVLILIINIYTRVSRRQSAFIVVLLLLVLVAGAFSFRERVALISNEGILITNEADARFEPFDRATTHFTLYEGMKVRVIERKEGWYKIKRADGKIGWIRKAALNII
ncbi:MAG: tetratricopeptide repeat protein [Candidatus Omnitrophica bacterium]|nr:tetratricopeptide repeat protein [Candidatus Omnitrophota bacterium]